MLPHLSVCHALRTHAVHTRLSAGYAMHPLPCPCTSGILSQAADMLMLCYCFPPHMSSTDRVTMCTHSLVPEAQTRVVQVQLQLVTATVKLFLKKPTERPQQMIQLVLTYATQETDNPDLRDRAYVYWSVPCLYLQTLSVACTFLKTCLHHC